MECIFDNGSEFLGEDFQNAVNNFGIKCTHTTVKNPQADMVERIHQMLGNILCTMELEQYAFTPNDPRSNPTSQYSIGNTAKRLNMALSHRQTNTSHTITTPLVHTNIL